MLFDAIANVPTEAWIGLAGVVFGSLLTTFGVWLTNRSNLAQLKRQLEHEDKRVHGRISKERFEELYVLTSAWLNGFFNNYLHLMNVMKGVMTYADYQDALVAQGASVDFSRIEMIVGVYGASILEKYEAVLSARSKLNVIVYEHKVAYERQESGEKFMFEFDRAQRLLEDKCEEFKAAVAKAARES